MPSLTPNRSREPRCGHCNYNLTGATSNRCPECGLLFIEAGVIVPRRRPRKWILPPAGMILLVVFLPALITIALTLHARARAAEAQARAQAARAEAVARFHEQMLKSAPATSPPERTPGAKWRAAESQPAANLPQAP